MDVFAFIQELNPIFLLTFVTSLLGIVLAVVGIINITLLRQSFALKKENQQLMAQLQEKTAAQFEQAGQELRRILEKSAQDAREIIQKTRFLSDDTKTQFLKDLSQVAEEEKKSYQASLREAHENIIKSFNNISKGIEESLQTDVSQLKSSLMGELQGVRKGAEEKAQVYQNALIEQAEHDVYELFTELTLHLLHKSLSLQDHQELIASAIKEAKNRHVI